MSQYRKRTSTPPASGSTARKSPSGLHHRRGPSRPKGPNLTQRSRGAQARSCNSPIKDVLLLYNNNNNNVYVYMYYMRMHIHYTLHISLALCFRGEKIPADSKRQSQNRIQPFRRDLFFFKRNLDNLVNTFDGGYNICGIMQRNHF